MAEAMLKRITGRDLIAARFMRKEFFEFRPSFLLNLATNFKPKFKGQDEGLWRRVKLIPWERYFAPAERDHLLGDKLLREAEGILAWAVRGAVEWYGGGLKDPAIVRDATKEYRETSDALAGFLPGVFTIDRSAGRMTGKALFDAYLDWATEENLPPREVWTRSTFFGALEERGLAKRKARDGVVFDGVRRARQIDHAPEEDAPEIDRAQAPVLAHSTSVTNMTGADLDSVL
jgi:putative DNA primase/helicase